MERNIVIAGLIVLVLVVIKITIFIYMTKDKR